MCAKPEPSLYLRPIGDLAAEMTQWENNPLPTLPWAGVTTFYGILENA